MHTYIKSVTHRLGIVEQHIIWRWKEQQKDERAHNTKNIQHEISNNNDYSHPLTMCCSAKKESLK